MHVMLERRPLPPKLRLRMARDTAAGILYMHRRGIIHRDVKSLNLLITEDYTTRCFARFVSLRAGCIYAV
jgi:serine/threonine protein kinase